MAGVQAQVERRRGSKLDLHPPIKRHMCDVRGLILTYFLLRDINPRRTPCAARPPAAKPQAAKRAAQRWLIPVSCGTAPEPRLNYGSTWFKVMPTVRSEHEAENDRPQHDEDELRDGRRTEEGV